MVRTLRICFLFVFCAFVKIPMLVGVSSTGYVVVEPSAILFGGLPAFQLLF